MNKRLLAACLACTAFACSTAPHGADQTGIHARHPRAAEEESMTQTSRAAGKPIIRIFELVIAPEHLDEFNRLGRNNITRSVNSEAGVLAMYVLADKDIPNKLYIVEAYADDAAYLAHRHSEHFQAWSEGTKGMIVSRKAVETLPVVFGSKAVEAK